MKRILISSDLDELNHRSAEAVVAAGTESILRSDRFTFLLSGGKTPRRLYELLASDAYRERMSWDRVHLFWGDERCLPPDHRDSNFRLAEETLIAPLGLPETHIHRIRGEYGVPEEAAIEYQDELIDFFRLQSGEFPRFDLALLGMGRDGHTASLFPSDPALQEQNRLVTTTQVAVAGVRRITLTLPTLNHARKVLFLISGADKAGAVSEVLGGSEPRVLLPARLIEPERGDVCFHLDKAAASRLSG